MKTLVSWIMEIYKQLNQVYLSTNQVMVYLSTNTNNFVYVTHLE